MKNTDKNKDLLTRLQKIEGQVRGIYKMVENERECIDIVNQLTAAKNALDKVSILIAENDFKDCIKREIECGKDLDTSIDKAIKLILRLRS